MENYSSAPRIPPGPALHMLKKRLLSAGVLLEVVHRANHSGWLPNANSTSHESRHVFAEATFVDDEAIYIRASSPTRLMQAIGITLDAQVAAFDRLGFKINLTNRKKHPPPPRDEVDPP